jgi:hypothetical protein
MIIDINTSVAGKKFSYPPGVHNVPDEIAKMLIKAGHAKKRSARKAKSEKE